MDKKLDRHVENIRHFAEFHGGDHVLIGLERMQLIESNSGSQSELFDRQIALYADEFQSSADIEIDVLVSDGTTDWAHGLGGNDSAVIRITRKVLDRLSK